MFCLNSKFSTTRMVVDSRPDADRSGEEKDARQCLMPVLFLPPRADRRGEGGLRYTRHFKQSYSEKPLVSIITVVFNGTEHLEQTIQSVLKNTSLLTEARRMALLILSEPMKTKSTTG